MSNLFSNKVVVDVSFSNIEKNQGEMEIAFTLAIELGSRFYLNLVHNADFMDWDIFDNAAYINHMFLLFDESYELFFSAIELEMMSSGENVGKPPSIAAAATHDIENLISEIEDGNVDLDDVAQSLKSIANDLRK